MALFMLAALLFFPGCDCDEAGTDARQKVEDARIKAVDGVKHVVKPLTEEDVKRYIQAYTNFASISAELEAQRKKSGAATIFTSKECRELLSKAVQDAGYADFKSFVLMDLRIHYAMRGVAYLRLAKLVGVAAEGMTADTARKQLEGKKDLAPEEKDQADKLLDTVGTLERHIAALASLVNQAADGLLRQADLDVVAKHFDEILAALTNPQLPAELRQSTGGGGDDWDD